MPFISDPATEAYIKKHSKERAARMAKKKPHKLQGKEKMEFLARMAKGRRKHAGRPRKPRRVSAHAAHLVKASVDRAAKEMKRMAAECTAEIKKVKAASKMITRGAKKKRKKRKAHAKPHHAKPHKAHRATHHKKPHHAKPHRKKHHKPHAHKGRPVEAADFAGAFGARATMPRHKRPVQRGDFARAFGHRAKERHVTAKQLLGRAGMKRWVCEAPVRTGCGGGASGGHVLGDLSRNVALRLRR